ncbi:MAG: hypothetical protein H7Z18_07195 [Methylophilaceae bacterium]|nr:hypothetical protein [Methylophilaceae bacterium]
MKNTYTNKLTVTVLLAGLAFISSTAFAGKDDIQSRATQQVAQFQQQIQVADMSKQDATTKVLACKKLVDQGKKC